MTADEYERMKNRVAELTQEKAQIDGALRELGRQMRKEFGVKTTGEAERLLRKLKKQQAEAEKKRDEAVKEFDEALAKGDES